MPHTVAMSFIQFYEAINLAGDHRATANARRDRIVALLEKEFSIVEAFHTGSIPRYTAVKGYADLDVIVALHYSKHIKGRDPSEVLKDVRDALAEYRTHVRRNGQAVTLYYETWPNVDIVPAYQSTDNQGSVTHYGIPDMHREVWLRSRPKTHSRNISSRSSTCGESFRKIIKMAKWWNHQHSALLQSYHIEAMALEAFTSTLDDTPWDVFCFFREAADLAASPLSYNGALVDDYLDYKRRAEVAKRLITARDTARSAWHRTHGTNDDHEGAIRLWRQIFGSKFPAYGS